MEWWWVAAAKAASKAAKAASKAQTEGLQKQLEIATVSDSSEYDLPYKEPVSGDTPDGPSPVPKSPTSFQEYLEVQLQLELDKKKK